MFDELINVQVTKDFTQDLKNSLKELSEKNICIGIPQEDDAYRGDTQYNATHKKKVAQGSNLRTGSGHITNAELLYILSNGVRDNTMIKSMQHDIKNGNPYSRAYEFYVQEHGSPLWRIPPRPVLAPAMESHKEEVAEQMKKALKAVLKGGSVSTELGKVGMLGQNICRDWFTNPENKWAKNSPITIKKKGSSNPLIDTGEMRKAITYVIRDKENG